MATEYDHHNVKNARIAKERMQKALKRVKAAMATESEVDRETKIGTGVAKALYPHIKKNSLKALHVYQGKMGGWYADVELKGLPPGVPKIMGTPSSTPWATKEEAEADGYTIVEAVLRIAAENEENKKEIIKQAVLEFYDVEFPMPLEVINDFIKDMGEPSRDHALDAIQELERLLVVNGKVVKERLSSLDQNLHQVVVSKIIIALAGGAFRWPKREEGRPGSKMQRH